MLKVKIEKSPEGKEAKELEKEKTEDELGDVTEDNVWV